MNNSLAPDQQIQRGALLLLGAIFLFTLMDSLAKELTQRYDPMMVAWARYSAQVLITVVILGRNLPALLVTKLWKLQLIRSVLLFGTTFFFYCSVANLGLAEATAIFEINPLVVTILAIFVLGEAVGPRRWVAVIAGLAGAIVIIRPGTEVFSPATLFPVLAAICYASYAVATRFLGHGESPWTSFVYTGLFGTVAAAILVIPVWQVPTLPDAGLMISLGCVGGAAQFLMILAFRAAPASALAPFSYFGLVLNALWGLIFFAEWPDNWTIAGALIIVGAGIYVWYRENQAR